VNHAHRVLALTLAVALAGGCAGRPRPALDLDAAAVRYAVVRDHREALLGAYTAELVVRVDGRGTGRLPALPATLQLATPDRVRLRASALIGVALDVLVTRDSVWAWVPSERLAFSAPGESLGISAPAAMAGRVIGATWSPPRAAWQGAAADSSGTLLGWREGGDTLSLLVGTDGLPARAWVGREGRGLTVRYGGWSRVGGEAFPSRFELADDSGWARVRVDCLDARSEDRADDGWFSPRRAAGWRAMGWDDLKSALERRGLP
jgi:hypothetical protein